jgi:Tol biopolymer transport system component
VNLSGSAGSIRWSPDQEKLRFTLRDLKTQTTSLWEVSPEGSDLHPLLSGWNNPPAECCGSRTPDGRYFVFQAARNGRTDIWRIREKGGLLGRAAGLPIRLTTGPLDFSGPLPSKDGRRLFVIGSQPRGELIRYDLKSGQFLPYLSGMSVEGVDVSRDGAWLTYVTFPEGILWRSRADGSESLQLTFPPGRAFLPRWSPDGKRIAFSLMLPNQPTKLAIISTDGGSPVEPHPEGSNEGDIGWSPDGNSLVFGSLEQEAPVGIHVIDLSTHKVATLPGSESLFSPRWSPDGRYIAALPLNNPDRLLVFDRRAERWKELCRLFIGYPSWSRDSKYVYFDSPQGEPGFYRVRVSDSKLEKIVNLKNVRLTGTFSWTGLAPDDSLLAVRDVGTEDIYALDVDLP